ncbi:hypothetical protein ANO11243_023110 [Dothideomycetidae sp. 11243]|nr:hypothetical protein ANO11243_023110 [fungal sp. No.11243]
MSRPTLATSRSSTLDSATSAPSPEQLGPPSASAASSSSNLSGLLCNVHITTGKEPPALVGASTTILGDKLYVFGGRRISRNRSGLTSDVYELDLLRRHWTRIEAKGDIPSPRYFHSVCALGDTKLVCYGGMSSEVNQTPEGSGPGDSPETQVTVMSDIHIYNVSTQTWIKVHTTESPQGRYAHCATILPSSAVFASANAPMSALHNNPSGEQVNSGSIGVSIDGTGGAQMLIVGGQDSANNFIEQISVFNLRSLEWTSTKQTTWHNCGAYRSVATPLTSMKASEVGAGVGKINAEDNEGDNPALSGSPMVFYSNYNFLDVKLELQIRLVDGTIVDKPMQTAVSPPGLRFPSAGIIDNHFVVAGTFLTSSKQEFALWALDLRNLTWAKIDVASSIFSTGSWNRGVLWPRRNAFVILGNRKRNLVDDYNTRRLNFTNMCIVQLEAFGLYENPRKMAPNSSFSSISAPSEIPAKDNLFRGGAVLKQAAVNIGEVAMEARELADMEILSLDGTRVPINSRIVARRWGASFNMLMQEANPAFAGTDTQTLRPSAASIISRNSSVTITPSVESGLSTGSTLVPRGGSVLSDVSTVTSLADAAELRNFPASSRPRIIYLPHTIPTINALLHFLYTSSLPPITSPLATPQILCSLLQLARPYKVDGLLEAVVERLHESLDGRNAAAIFNAAAMGAGGGDGIDLAGTDQPAHPPRTASLVGMHTESLGMENDKADKGNLRIDTNMANGVKSQSTTRSGSTDGNITESDEDEGQPSSATSSASMSSHMSTDRPRSRRQNNEVWNGGWSAVIGLQKRGLRGLMEGRRLRERVKPADGGPGAAPESARVGLGIA